MGTLHVIVCKNNYLALIVPVLSAILDVVHRYSKKYPLRVCSRGKSMGGLIRLILVILDIPRSYCGNATTRFDTDEVIRFTSIPSQILDVLGTS
eukprot:SAG11_NODE_5185_length_1636_cov_4.247885_1_plen_93_part_10